MDASGAAEPDRPTERSEVDAEQILGLIARPGPSRLRVAQVADMLGQEDEAVAGPLAALLASGRAHLWREAPGGPALVLDVQEARRRGLALDDESRHWRLARKKRRSKEDRVAAEHTGVPGVRVIRASELGRRALAGGLGRLADRKAVKPGTAAMYNETISRAVSKVLASLPIGDYECDRIPAPGLYVGLRHVWDALPFDKALCKGCGRLVANPAWHPPMAAKKKFKYVADDLRALGTYCLACDRYGWELRLPKVRPVVIARGLQGPAGRKPYPGGNGQANGHTNGKVQVVALKGGRS